MTQSKETRKVVRRERPKYVRPTVKSEKAKDRYALEGTGVACNQGVGDGCHPEA